MKVSIIFHSVCGNTFLMAKGFQKAFDKLNVEASIFRAADSDLQKWSEMFPAAQETYNELVSIPVAEPKVFKESDLVILGSPTYFGNVSAEMKAVMDSTSIYWIDAALAGKKLSVFTSCASREGGAALCLKSMITFGQHMGMIHIPLLANLVANCEINAYGITHYSGNLADARPGIAISELIESYVEYLVENCK